jgi:transglutaminase/protease-like cytokinesis protein 3
VVWENTITINVSVSSTLSITTSTLPGGMVGSSYSATLSATGGTPPYSWSIVSGSLPSGLTLSTAGVISGTPSSTGTFSFTVQVRDSSSPAQTAQKTFSVMVQPQNQLVHVTYQAHVAGLGWMSPVQDGQTAGTTGQGRQMEALKISVSQYNIQYQAHVAYDGWQGWVSDGAVAGTTGQGKAMKAIKIQLQNAPANLHVCYRAHVAYDGWQGWVCDGAMAGTTGQSKAIEAIEIKIQ